MSKNARFDFFNYNHKQLATIMINFWILLAVTVAFLFQ